MRRRLAAGWLAAALLAGGCAEPGEVSVSRRPPGPVRQVDKVVLRLSPPTPVNWDESPGSDGLQAQVHFFQLDEPLPVTVAGTLEFALYEGRPAGESLQQVRPFRTWAFDADQLNAHLGRSIFGWGYAMRLGWGRRPPASRTITLIARYRPTDGEPTASAPIQVATGPR